MTNREKYIDLCKQQNLPLHAQAWWWMRAALRKEWSALILEDADGQILAAMPYLLTERMGLRALLSPIHTQYNPIYFSPNAPSCIYEDFAQVLNDLCRTQRVGWVQIQGFYPQTLMEALRTKGFSISKRTTYRIATVPARAELSSLFSQNKRRQLQKAKNLHLAELSVEAFYSFHSECLSKQNKHIDYPHEWAEAVLNEAVDRQRGRLLAAQDKDGQILAAMFLAWDDKQAYYLLPTYDAEHKNSGAMTWLTVEALCIAHDKGLAFDFEGSMTDSIASSYKQFGGQPETYYRIEKGYGFFVRFILRLYRAFGRGR